MRKRPFSLLRKVFMKRWACLFFLVLGLAPPLAADRLLACLGDSLTAGYGLDEGQAYPALIEKTLSQETPAWRVVNAGVSGDTSAGGLKRVDWILRSHPDAVFVALGANDGLRGFDPTVTEANLLAIIRKLKAAGVQPYLAGLDLPTNLGADYRERFKAVYPRVAQAEHVPLMGFLLTGVAGQAGLNLADGMHPNAQGHVIVAAHVLAFLQPRLRSLALGASKNKAAPKVLRRRNPLEGAPL
jgi:acyl-CoA thioesterase-1